MNILEPSNLSQCQYGKSLHQGRHWAFAVMMFFLLNLLTGCDALSEKVAAMKGGLEATDTEQAGDNSETLAIEAVNVTGISRLRDVSEPINDRYLVQLMKLTLSEEMGDVVERISSRHGIEVDLSYRHVFYGFSAGMTREQAEAVAADADVAYVEQDSFFSVAESEVVEGKSSGVPWGLGQLAGEVGEYRPAYGGTGVNVYILSTGVNSENKELQTRVGRGVNVGFASPWLASMLGQSQPGVLMRLLGKKPQAASPNDVGDCHGHGTRMATIAAGKSLGAAPMANIRPVKVFDCNGRGAASGVLQALEWLFSRYQRPAVMLLPFEGGKSKVVDAAIRNLQRKDILTVAAAGDSGVDACEVSPAGVRSVLSVGGYNSTGSLAEKSNTGKCVDLLLPAAAIDSSDHRGVRQLVTGSSAAAAYAAGVAAQFREAHGRQSKLAVLRELNKQVAEITLTISGEAVPSKTLLVPLR